jgi:hypothetical protein
MEDDVQRAIRNVRRVAREHGTPLGERFANAETTPAQMLAAIDVYRGWLREGIALNETLPISNCVREIRRRITNLRRLDPEQARQTEASLREEFPDHF